MHYFSFAVVGALVINLTDERYGNVDAFSRSVPIRRLTRSTNVVGFMTLQQHEDWNPNGPAQLSRREALSLAGAVVLTAASLQSPLAANANQDSVAVPIGASWSAVDGLNANNNFVSFDATAYKAMKDDPTRTPLFKAAIIRQLGTDPESKTVLDLGTGPFALFAIMAAQVGAGKVYAMEADPQAAQSAQQAITKAGYDDVITLLQGFSTELTLPTKADVVICEIVGSVASEEGAYATVRDAHERLVKYPTLATSWIPHRIQTYAAPASYTLHNLFGPPEFNWDKLNGEPVRFNCRDKGLELLADPIIIEDIDFCNIMDKEQKDLIQKKKELLFTIDPVRMEGNVLGLYEEFRRGNSSPAESERLASETAHSMSGIALWPRLFLNDNVVIDSRSYPAGNHQRSHWQTVLPIMSARPVGGLKGGEQVQVTAEFLLPESVTKAPAYRLFGNVVFPLSK